MVLFGRGVSVSLSMCSPLLWSIVSSNLAKLKKLSSLSLRLCKDVEGG